MQAEMTVEGYEVIAVKSEDRPQNSRVVKPKFEKSLPEFSESFGDDIKRIDKIILDNITSFSPEALQADGFVETRVLDITNLSEDERFRTREQRDNNASISVFDHLIGRLTAIDSRIEGRYTGTLRDEKKMRQKLQFGSEAMAQMQAQITTIRERLNDEFRLISKGRHAGNYTVKDFNLISPDISGTSERIRDRYRVRTYQNAIHAEYNGLNPFEVQVAAALDKTGLAWCRNPSKTGYGVPIAEIGTETQKFYPDFLLWTDQQIWAIDPKGAHLKEGAVQNKLFDVTGVPGVTTPVRVALILEGEHVLNQYGQWISSKKDEGVFTLVRRMTTGVKSQPFSSLTKLFDSLLKT
jgi:type III restriction enzyme